MQKAGRIILPYCIAAAQAENIAGDCAA